MSQSASDNYKKVKWLPFDDMPHQTCKRIEDTAFILWHKTCSDNKTRLLMLKQRRAESPPLHNTTNSQGDPCPAVLYMTCITTHFLLALINLRCFASVLLCKEHFLNSLTDVNWRSIRKQTSVQLKSHSSRAACVFCYQGLTHFIRVMFSICQYCLVWQ